MIWLTWRQHRMQLLAGTAVLALLAAFMLPSGFAIASGFRDSGLAECFATPGRDCGALQTALDSRYSTLWFAIPLFLVVPVFIGVFWGAPLVAREVEQGTHRLAWTQNVSRMRWTVTKVMALAAATVLGTALFAWLLSWWSSPLVASTDDGFSFGIFGLRGIVPVAYALFALAVGVAAGALIGRTVPAMAATVAVFATVRLVVELWVRPHFAGARTLSYAFLGTYPRSGLGDWVLSTKTVDGAGHVLANGEQLNLDMLSPRCPGLVPSPGAVPDDAAVQECVQRVRLHVQVTYHPANRFWLFQGIETAIFVSLALALLAFTVWWVRRRLA